VRFAVFAAGALALGAPGLYGLTSHAVAERARELGALLLSRLRASLLHGVTTTDPLVFGAAAATLMLAAVAACLVPAWRASRVDPVTCLRGQ
jgi:ABC-type antimicrobial peptide transport system permease subunit